jgi:hypothetical protein
MIKIFLEIFKRLKNSIANEKVFHLLIITILFTFLYLFLDDTHFSGINKLQQIMRDELIKKEVKKTVLIEKFSKNIIGSNNEKLKEYAKDDAIDKTKDEVAIAIDDDELTPGKIDQSLLQKTYNRFYYAIITGCLLGYGDIYPISNIAKLISMVQSFITISLIIH